jgi:hypothetical protein
MSIKVERSLAEACCQGGGFRAYVYGILEQSLMYPSRASRSISLVKNI